MPIYHGFTRKIARALYIRILIPDCVETAVTFYKYQGTGNDFIMIDDREDRFHAWPELISAMCDRHFGIGGDGLLILREADGYDFEMIYYNSDGSPATFCGNGGRCMVAFALHLGIIGREAYFLAPDGPHNAEIVESNQSTSIVNLGMKDAIIYEQEEHYVYLNTGTFHTVFFEDDIESLDVMRRAPKIRYDRKYAPHGTNVNFVSHLNNYLHVRTYEKGVESETLSCGTGVTASAVAASLLWGGNHFIVNTRGGRLEVSLLRKEDRFVNVVLHGPATRVYAGTYIIRENER